ncbi:MAG: 23S rRNA (uracil(1939)-C(5))-methyltransferase RlmD [Anaerolineae bacterium]|nr:23S rRNA (uracil(1939)-C(5))-methyltransferase RlmD [Anaerolineae bacterium]MDH7475270.1 23S rRNA (uracil(1939)-C(5))-methyltransferase RlmD [Anaerolineae bacterium]
MNRVLELELTGIAHGGDALGRYEGQAIFVPYGIPDEKTSVEIIEDRGRWARARLVEVLRPSPHRVNPPCPYFGQCGGCQWQHMDYQAQLVYKRIIVSEQLHHLGGLEDFLVEPTLPSPDIWHYRNHAQFAPSPDGGLGFRSSRSRQVVPITECLLLHPLLSDLFSALDLALPTLERLALRAGVRSGETMLIFETVDDEPPEIEVDIPVSCVLLLKDGTPVNLVGRNHFVELLGHRRFRVSAPSFFQVNTAQAEQLVETVAALLQLSKDETLLDVYCGVGTFALSLAEQAYKVIGVEENPYAIEDAILNAEGVSNVEFIKGQAEVMLPALDLAVNAAVLDPPRQGCHPQALQSLMDLAPERIVYVSCDPATLARDARQLIAGGYHLIKVQPVDMFPQTYHIETVSLWSR